MSTEAPRTATPTPTVSIGDDPVVDLVFPVTGLEVPADHGYLLYAALSAALPDLHDRTDYGIHPIAGLPVGERRLRLTRRSRVVVRLPASAIPVAVRLGGRPIVVGSDRLTLGAPRVRPLRPSPTLHSRIVVIRGFTEPEPFLDAARRQFAALGCHGSLDLLWPVRPRRLEGATPGRIGPIRRTVQIHGRVVVGFPLLASGLDVHSSHRLQEAGLGGRRRFGCGVFVPRR